MTTKTGIHVSSGDRKGFGDFLATCANSGNPASVIFAVDQDVWPDVQKLSPKTKVIFRTQPGGLDNPENFYGQDATTMARNWMNAIMPKWKLNKADYYAPGNELDIVDVASARQLNDFYLECMKVADANGYKLAIYAFSGGNPRDSADSTLEQKWQPLIPSMQYAKVHGHILLLHEYSFYEPSLQASAPDLALRYRRSYAYLKSNNAETPIVVSECSSGVGYGTALSGQSFVDDVKWYDQQAKLDPYLMGFALYQAGGAENLKDAFGLLSKYVSSIIDNPAEKPEEDNARTQYKRIYVLIHPTLSGAGYYVIADKHKITVGPSADDAGLGNLADKTVVAVNPELWGGDVALKNFFDTYYSGTKYLSVSVSSPEELDSYLVSHMK